MRGRWGLAAAWLLSLSVPLAEAALGRTLAQGSLAVLALLPWLALACVPRRPAAASFAEPFAALRAALFVGGCALPPVLLGAGLDLARGSEPGALLAACAAGWGSLLLWGGACASATAGRARSLYAALWFVLVPGAAALRLALAWVPLRAGVPAPPQARLFALDPLLACHRLARADAFEALAPSQVVLPLVAALGVLVLVRASAAREARA